MNTTPQKPRETEVEWAASLAIGAGRAMPRPVTVEAVDEDSARVAGASKLGVGAMFVDAVRMG